MSRGSTAFHNGIAAEEIAARAYEARGGTIMARRWKVREGEIDLVVDLGGVLVFVEVKFRKSIAAALEAVSPAQQARISACATHYLAKHGGLDSACRFDLAAIDREGRIEVIENFIIG